MNQAKPVNELLSLQNQNVLITGGAGFLGYYFCEAVIEMSGNPIILDLKVRDIDSVKAMLKENKNTDVEGYAIDLTKPSSITETIRTVIADVGKIDCLVNGAAFAMKNMQDDGRDFFAPFETYEKDLWQASLDVNLTGTFLITQKIGAHMKENQSGSIVNIASDVAVISPDHRIYQKDSRFDYEGVPFNTPIAYSVTKAGILAFTRYLATYWAQDGIRVNAISPTGVHRNQDEKFKEQLAYRIPLGRMAHAAFG